MPGGNKKNRDLFSSIQEGAQQNPAVGFLLHEKGMRMSLKMSK